MKKEDIKSRELKRLIAMKVNKLDFDDVTDEEIAGIRDITLNAYLMNGSESNITLRDLLYFPNLERVRISNFEITAESIEIFAMLERLEGIEITSCIFKDVDFSRLNGKVKAISFTNCADLPFEYPDVKDIRIVRSNIDFRKINFKNVQTVFMQNCNIRNVYDLNEYTDIKSINLDGSKLFSENEQLVQDIAAGANTVYTHERTVYYYDYR